MNEKNDLRDKNGFYLVGNFRNSSSTVYIPKAREVLIDHLFKVIFCRKKNLPTDIHLSCFSYDFGTRLLKRLFLGKRPVKGVNVKFSALVEGCLLFVY